MRERLWDSPYINQVVQTAGFMSSDELIVGAPISCILLIVYLQMMPFTILKTKMSVIMHLHLDGGHMQVNTARR